MHHTSQREVRPQRLLGALAPRASPKSAVRVDALRELLDLDLLVAQSTALVEHADDSFGVDGDGVVKTERSDAFAKLDGVAVREIREHDSRWNTGFTRSPDHPERELGLGRELELPRNPRDLATHRVLRPAFR